MRVAVVGATGVVGRSALRGLVDAGHDVVALARTPDRAELLASLGAEPITGTLGDERTLVSFMEGSDVVCSFVGSVPPGGQSGHRGAWRDSDRVRTEGVRRIVAAARAAGVRRLVQGSVSFLYAENGDGWVTESSPLGISPVTEPASVCECHVEEFRCGSRHAVVLRFGTVLGSDETTSWPLHALLRGRTTGLGADDGWAHVVHVDDVAAAVAAAVTAPGGLYNVGAEPVLRADLAVAFLASGGRPVGRVRGAAMRRLAGVRAEPLARSQRVSSAAFTADTGWRPRHGQVDPSWFAPVAAEREASR
jgi:nucleoside-diphosphate-sugar epimerase